MIRPYFVLGKSQHCKFAVDRMTCTRARIKIELAPVLRTPATPPSSCSSCKAGAVVQLCSPSRLLRWWPVEPWPSSKATTNGVAVDVAAGAGLIALVSLAGTPPTPSTANSYCPASPRTIA
jgi:hypothetical protein